MPYNPKSDDETPVFDGTFTLLVWLFFVGTVGAFIFLGAVDLFQVHENTLALALNAGIALLFGTVVVAFGMLAQFFTSGSK